MQLHDDEDTNGMVYNSEGKRAENVVYVQIFHGIPFLHFEGHVLLMEEQPIITFRMKSLSEKVYQHF